MNMRAVCVEIGGGSAQTTVFDAAGVPSFRDGAHHTNGAPLLLAVPGIVEEGRVLAASNLGWYDVDPVTELGLHGPASVLANDAEAAALGESVLRGMVDLGYLGLGTGIGGAIVRDGGIVATEVFGHRTGFSSLDCPCGRIGCLETVAAGWALPDLLPRDRVQTVSAALARALRDPALPDLIVIGGGIARRYPRIVDDVRRMSPNHHIETSRAPEGAKSAAAWGLLHLAGLATG
jgi:predicted NBD/HSP70 family sugar kinase